MTPVAAGAGSGLGVPLWLVCVVAFAAMSVLFSIALLAPSRRSQRVLLQARLDELGRYRFPTTITEPAKSAAAERGPNPIAARALRAVDRVVRARGKREAVASQLERSGVRLRPEEWVAIHLSATIGLGLVMALFLGGVVGLVLGAVIGWLLCRLYLKWRVPKRMDSFAAQLPDSLQLLAGALRAGFALNHAIGSIVREGTEPSASEFGRVLTEVRLGAELEDALEALAERMESRDLDLVLMAIKTSREVGGNLAEILDTTVATMRERCELRGQVKVLSAEGRMSAKVLMALPVLMVGYMKLTNPTYIKFLYTTTPGMVMSGLAVGLLLVGGIWLNRLTKIEV